MLEMKEITSLEQWFLNLSVHQNHLVDLLEQTAGPHLWNDLVGLQ